MHGQNHIKQFMYFVLSVVLWNGWFYGWVANLDLFSHWYISAAKMQFFLTLWRVIDCCYTANILHLIEENHWQLFSLERRCNWFISYRVQNTRFLMIRRNIGGKWKMNKGELLVCSNDSTSSYPVFPRLHQEVQFRNPHHVVSLWWCL